MRQVQLLEQSRHLGPSTGGGIIPAQGDEEWGEGSGPAIAPVTTNSSDLQKIGTIGVPLKTFTVPGVTAAPQPGLIPGSCPYDLLPIPDGGF